MADESAAGEIALLRSVLSDLETRLEALEEWRALRQLDERERNGNPLQGIDGVSFRGRLVQGLAQTSRDWRAYVRIEEAIGHLQGPARPGQGILKEIAAFESPQVRLPPSEQPATPGLAAPGAPPVPQMTGNAPETELPDAQRLRVKVRAGSLLVALPSIPVRAILAPARQGHGADEPPAVATLSPRPTVQREQNLAAGEPLDTVLPGQTVADLRSPRSVLQRIRLVSKGGDGAKAGDVPTSVEPAAPAPAHLTASTSEAAAVPAILGLPPALPTAESLRPERPGFSANSGWLERAVPVTAAAPGISEARSPGFDAAFDRPDAPLPVADNAAQEQRLEALETELGQLIDQSASWPHPLDARRNPPGSHVVNRQFTAALEPDTTIELDVEEAEVTIVKLAATEMPESAPRPSLTPASFTPPARPQALSAQALSATAHPTKSAPALSPDLQSTTDGDDDSPNDGYAGYHLELEEASVEIIVPDRPSHEGSGDEPGVKRGQAARRGNPAE